MKNPTEVLMTETVAEEPGSRELEQLLAQSVEQRPRPASRERIDGVLVGTLVGFRDPYEPLVIYPGQRGTAAVTARASVDLHAEHIGHEVTLVFEDGDPGKPIVTGRIRVPSAWRAAERPPQVEVDADGKRLMLTASDQLVLRCGAASITLSKAGKVMIHGTYVSNRSTGVMRIKGGSVEIN
jgi:hypothetical protein